MKESETGVGIMPVSFFVQHRHTAEYPYCKNVLCWCHISSEYHDIVTSPHLCSGVSRSAFEEALLFLSGQESSNGLLSLSTQAAN